LSEKELDEKNDEVIIYFSKLQPILQNYQQFDKDNVCVEGYLTDSLNSFLKDEGLSIIHVLNHLRAIINTHKLDLSQELIHLSLTLLERNKVDRLRQLQLQIINLNKKLTDFNLENENKVFFDKLDDAYYRLQHFQEQEEQLNNQITDLEDNLGETSELRLREKNLFQNLVRIGLNKELVIILN
jgi:hypothetical protein